MKPLRKIISLKEQLEEAEEAIAEIGRDDPLEESRFEQEPKDRHLSGTAVLSSTFLASRLLKKSISSEIAALSG